jgi:hypothetical protein
VRYHFILTRVIIKEGKKEKRKARRKKEGRKEGKGK